jgi:hypothetical protein
MSSFFKRVFARLSFQACSSSSMTPPRSSARDSSFEPSFKRCVGWDVRVMPNRQSVRAPCLDDFSNEQGSGSSWLQVSHSYPVLRFSYFRAGLRSLRASTAVAATSACEAATSFKSKTPICQTGFGGKHHAELRKIAGNHTSISWNLDRC